MKFEPYRFQQEAADHALSFFESAAPGDRQLYAAPTGCGKSIVELLVHERLTGAWIVTPREEIIAGMMDKLGATGDPMSHRITTPIKLRNRLLSGAVQTPTYLILDETHHESAETWRQLDLLAALCPAVGYTATPYRGSPRSTKDFLDRWGEPLWLITLAEAANEGYVTIPRFTVLPLVDDDVVEVRAGEFDVSSIESATLDRVGDLALHATEWKDGAKWDTPTIFAMPTRRACLELQEALAARGMPSVVVSADTPSSERAAAFKLVEAGVFALLHINIVSEGVDLRLRRLVDCAPTLSPVKWVQQLGRITRPGGSSVYVGTNRNIMRHAYALEGAVPVSAVVETENAFPSSSRAHVRALGLEAIGRFKPAHVRLLSGALLGVYSLSALVADTSARIDYVCLVPPTSAPIWASKVRTVKDGVTDWGKWQEAEAPEGLRGFSSTPPRELSDKQKAWWNRSARHFGLDSDAEVDRKSFVALPVLSDIGVRLS